MPPTFMPKGVNPQPADQRNMTPYALQAGYENAPQQQPSARPTAGATLVPPSVLRSAVNAPQFVPKATPPPPSLGSLTLVSLVWQLTAPRMSINMLE
jgi:hypothetical protein